MNKQELKQFNEELDYILEDFHIVNEMTWIDKCGKELTKEISIELCKKHSQLSPLKSDSIDAKVSWLIRYIDLVSKEELEGLKISNIGTISYTENDKVLTQDIILSLGDTDKNNKVLFNSNHGLYHMKYGINKHWEKSKQALHLIPRSIKNGKKIPGETPYKYNIIYRDKGTHKLYFIGVPSEYGNATILISCL